MTDTPFKSSRALSQRPCSTFGLDFPEVDGVDVAYVGDAGDDACRHVEHR